MLFARELVRTVVQRQTGRTRWFIRSGVAQNSKVVDSNAVRVGCLSPGLCNRVLQTVQRHAWIVQCFLWYCVLKNLEVI